MASNAHSHPVKPPVVEAQGHSKNPAACTKDCAMPMKGAAK